MRCIFFISAAFSTVALVVALMLAVARRRYRKKIREKEMVIVRELHERDKLTKELEHIRIEKELLERIIFDKHQ
jgi:hypothetical protein